MQAAANVAATVVTSTTHQSISTLRLPPSLLLILQSAGFTDILDFADISALELSRELNTSVDNALTILTHAKETLASQKAGHAGSGLNGADIVKPLPSSSRLLSNTQQATSLALNGFMNSPIITFCREIDSALGGGIPSGQVTELCGVPGIGKTQMAMQLALDLQIPAVFRGCGGEAVYIDTEGSCLPTRLAVMAAALTKHLQQIAKTAANRQNQLSQMSQRATLSQEQVADLQQKQSSVDKKVAEAAAVSVTSLMTGIHMFRTHDQTELLAVIAQLSAFLESHPKVKLVVIDSIAFPFRQDQQGQDSGQRTRQLSSVSQDLYRNALQHRVAVVVVNHVTTKVFRGSDTMDAAGHGYSSSTPSQIVPALGELWSHAVTNRIIMHWERSPEGCSGLERAAYLVKSPSRPCSRATFAVLPVGVRDVPTSNKTPQVRTRPDSESRPSQEVQNQFDIHNQTPQSENVHHEDGRQSSVSSAHNTTAENVSEYKRVRRG